MNNAVRAGQGVAVIAVIVVAFLVLRPTDSDNGTDASKSKSATQTTSSKPAGGGKQPTATAESAPEPPAPVFQLSGHEVKGKSQPIEARKGDTVRFTVKSDADDDIHLHGYDIEKPVGPGKPAKFKFKATIEGQFEIESHHAEEEGKEPEITQLVVRPS